MLQIFTNLRFLSKSSLRLLPGMAALIICFAATNILAATLTVTRSDDRDQSCSPGVDCSLREAVKAANATAANDVIDFAPGVTIITLASGDTGDIKIIPTGGALAISGPGAGLLTIDGGPGGNRIFDINNAAVTISDLKIQGGGGNQTGSTGGVGGAISAGDGSLILSSVIIDANGGPNVLGGALYLFAGTHRIINSTISNNQSKGATIYLANSGGLLSIVNSTIAGNSAGDSGPAGGGIGNEGTIKIRNSTITNNSAAKGDGGGITNFGTINVGNSIIAGNIALGEREIANYGATITSVGYNLIGDTAGDAANTGTAVTYQASDILDTDPKLGALALANGGSTPTCALLPGSPAIDKGADLLAVDPFNAVALSVDQRGSQRIVDGDGDNTASVDIGAYEVQLPSTAASVSISGRVFTGGKGLSNAKVELTGTGGATRTVLTNAFGNFTINNVEAGATYVINVSAKKYTFAPQVISVTDNISGLTFTARQIYTD